jgi:Domain of unknown function (DUF4276)
LIRVYTLVEGQTEETFIKRVLGPHLQELGVYLTPVLVMTKRVKDGRKFKGGISRYAAVRKDLQRLLADRSAAAITTMIDYYGVPEDFPGHAAMPRAGSCYDRVAHLEAALRSDLDDPRFRAYLSLHEFEALLLAAPEMIGSILPEGPFAARLAEEIRGFRSPEEIDDGPETHPAARILRLAPPYRKTMHGPLAVERIGLATIRQNCPHFDEWVTWLEGLRPA